MKPELADARHKLNRAGFHIAHLESWINGRLSADYYRLTVEPEGGNRLSYNFQSLHDLNRDAEAIIGDAIGNLRSSLDYVVGALIFPITGERKNTGFPFANDAIGFAGEVRANRCFGLLPQSFQDLIINEVQAYKGGTGEALWVLNQLRNIDKHRLLITTQRLAAIVLSFQDANGNMFHEFEVGVPENQKITAISAPIGHVKIIINPRPAFEICIEEPPYLQRAEVLEYLKKCLLKVNNIIELIETSR